MPLAPDTYTRNYYLKSVMEDTFGTRAWYDLKETTDDAIWIRYFTKTLDSFEISIKENVKVCDDEWRAEITSNISEGKERMSTAATFDEALSVFCATLMRQSYLQLGMIPKRRGARSDRAVSLHKVNWKFDGHRSVQYVQTSVQRDALFRSKLQKEVGFEEEMGLYKKYKNSGANFSFEQWYRKNNPSATE